MIRSTRSFLPISRPLFCAGNDLASGVPSGQCALVLGARFGVLAVGLIVAASCGSASGRTSSPSGVPVDSASSIETTTSFVDTNGTVPNPEMSQPFPADWVLDPSFTLTPDTSSLHLIVTEIQCASGIDPTGRIEATVDYLPTEVRVSVIVNSVGGYANCPGNPPTPFVLPLKEALGDRTVVGATGGLAVWTIATDAPTAATSQTFTAQVRRLDCSSGSTGTVLPPAVEFGPTSVVVTFTVEPLPPGEYTCPPNDEVGYLVSLGEPIGNRELVDGACRTDQARTTSFCKDGATRWPGEGATRFCSAPDLIAKPLASGGEIGSWTLLVGVDNVSGSPCQLPDGPPLLNGVGEDGVVVELTTVPNLIPDPPPLTGALEPAAEAVLRIEYVTGGAGEVPCPESPPETWASLQIGMPDGTVIPLIQEFEQRCGDLTISKFGAP